ncbi:hypothetical protein K435DRAFT_855107 [Dendrothele bispora CBS 962.96]|uniref:Uncharacterized protein n=1 Tax=Dendrothele bispora (strain CBS 962.96) TaxID=1314807 RepID=A0A4S8MBX1_DENBC|nr:hypothetical protein K435DRAFT_855107 [Dendrothele bispora CBS 962.96]
MGDRIVPVPANPDNPSRPSDEWMRSRAWIDGAVNPPVMYFSHGDIETVWNYWAERLPQFRQQQSQTTSIPVIDIQAQMPVQDPSDPPPYYRPHVYRPIVPTSDQHAEPAIEPAATSTNLDREYSVAVTKTYQVLETKPPSTRARNKVSQPKSIAKSDTLPGTTVIAGTGRVAFVEWFLKLHQLDDQYAPGPLHRPPFYFWWQGLTKTSRFTIENDTQFNAAVNELRKCNPNRAHFRVFVEFDVDSMHGWRVRAKRPVEDQTGDDQEMTHGIAVPSLEAYSNNDQMKGHFVGKLKKTWGCNTHKNEHGGSGFCWVDSEGQHVGLNMKVMGKWAEEILNGEATVKVPPNIPGIETARNGKPSVRPRGRQGARSGKGAQEQAVSPPSTDSATALLLAGVTTLMSAQIHHTSQHRSRSRSHSRSRSRSHSRGRRHSRSHRKRPRHHSPSLPSSPYKAEPTLDLAECLSDFFVKHQIDMRPCQEMLEGLSFTPDVIPDVSVERLCNVMNMVEGKVIKFRKFCVEWVEMKHRHHRN